MTQPKSFLPLEGAAGRALAALIDAGHPRRASEVATAAGVSRFAVSRALPTLEEAGLVVEAFDRTYAFNPDHPLAAIAMRQLWHLYGSRPPAGRDYFSDPENSFHPYGRVIPGWATQETEEVLTALVPHGPSMLAARYMADRLRALLPDLVGLQSIGRSVFSSWYDERSRDFIHRAINLGTATAAAIAVLDKNASMKAQGTADPLTTAVHPDQWGRAIYLVNADARWLESLTQTFEDSSTLGMRISATREAALKALARGAKRSLFPEHQEDADTDTATSARYAAYAEQKNRVDQVDALKRLTAAQSAFDDAKGELHHLGGMPTIAEFGRNGDMVLSVLLRQRLKSLLAVLDDMRTEECWEPWRSAREDLPRLAGLPDDVSFSRVQDNKIPIDDVTATEVEKMYF